MTDGIYAVNAHILTPDKRTIMLVEIPNPIMIEDLFHVVGKNSEEWYVMINETVIDYYLNHVNPRDYDADIYEFATTIKHRIKELSKELELPTSSITGLVWTW